MVAPATYAQMRYVAALIMTGPMASPSRPSVRFTAFEVATTTSTANGTYTERGSSMGYFENAKNGTARRVLMADQSAGRLDGPRKVYPTAAPPMRTCPSSLYRP